MNRDADFAEAAWTWFEQHRHIVDRAIDSVIKSRRWREAVSRGEALSECAQRLPSLLRTYQADNLATLETHVEVGLRHYLHKLCVRQAYGVNPSARVAERHSRREEQLDEEHEQLALRVADDAGALARLLVQEMLEAIGAVHPLYRWLLERRYEDEMTLDAVAVLLDKSKSTARRYMKGAEDAARSWAAKRGGDGSLLPLRRPSVDEGGR